MRLLVIRTKFYITLKCVNKMNENDKLLVSFTGTRAGTAEKCFPGRPI